MFDSAYTSDVTSRLISSYSPRSASGKSIVTNTSDVLNVIWQPGDGTRYEATAVVLPDENTIYVFGKMIEDTFVFEAPAISFIHTGYFISKCHLPGLNQYTRYKFCQLVAAMLRMDTDANDEELFAQLIS